MATDIAVMCRGHHRGAGAARRPVRAPHHPYTKALLAAVPSPISTTCSTSPRSPTKRLHAFDLARALHDPAGRAASRYGRGLAAPFRPHRRGPEGSHQARLMRRVRRRTLLLSALGLAAGGLAVREARATGDSMPADLKASRVPWRSWRARSRRCRPPMMEPRCWRSSSRAASCLRSPNACPRRRSSPISRPGGGRPAAMAGICAAS